MPRWFRKYFIPHAGNLYKPHFLRETSVAALLAVVLAIELVFLAQVLFVFKKTDFLAAVLPGALTSLTNEKRAPSGATPLGANPLLARAAQMKAEDMAARGYFSHVDPDGRAPWRWLEEAGYDYSYAGENLAVNFLDSEDVAEAWMNSPSHRANIIKKEFTEVGIGVARGTYEGRESVFVVEFFGTPALPALARTETDSAQGSGRETAAAPREAKVLGEATVKAPAPRSPPLSAIERVATAPRVTASYAFGALLALITVALSLALFIEMRIQHPRLLASGAALLVLIGLLSFTNQKALRGELKVPTDDLSASAIRAIDF